MSTILTPKWQPIPFTGESTPPGASFFEPALVPERAVLVTGGPLLVSVFQVYSSKRLWYSVKGQVWISGFCVSASSLYVQDGPVLSGWDLTEGGCFAAINLVTKQRWTPPADSKVSVQPPKELYALPPAEAASQERLVAARYEHARASLDEHDGLRAGRAQLASAALSTAFNDAPLLTFSAPVARAEQFDGPAAGEVFSLAMDGTVRALDAALLKVNARKGDDLPLRPELMLGEVRQPSGDVMAHLYYVTRDGGVARLNGSANPIGVLPKWPGKGAPSPDKVLPLRFYHDLVWGGGIFDSDFFIAQPDDTLTLVQTVEAPAGGWRRYDIARAERLVLLSNGSASGLVSYDRSARQRERWRLRTAPSPAYSLFWSGTGKGTEPSTPCLVIEADQQPRANEQPINLRIVLANTIDSENPAFTSDFPPFSTQLHDVTLAPGSFPALSSIRWLRCTPVVANQTLYCVVRTSAQPGTGADFVVAFSLAADLAAASTEAPAMLARLVSASAPLRIVITYNRFLREEIGGTSYEYAAGKGPLANRDVLLDLSAGPPISARTDAAGSTLVDTSKLGLSIAVSGHTFRYGGFAGSTSVTLAAGATPTIVVKLVEEAPRAVPPTPTGHSNE